MSDNQTENNSTQEQSSPVSNEKLNASSSEDSQDTYQDINDETLDSILESLLFVSEKPVQKKRVYEILKEIKPDHIDLRLEALLDKHTGAGFELVKINQGYQFRTHPDNSEYLLRLYETKPVRLSRGNLETLSIVAYRQPITRPEVDEIRGVDSGHMLRTLMERNLIKILGKRDEAGNPLIYGTTAEFLEFFQLSNLSDLPALTEYTELGEESLKKLEKLLPQSITAEELNTNSDHQEKSEMLEEPNEDHPNQTDVNLQAISEMTDTESDDILPS